MVTRKSGATRVAVAISLILHVAAFITLALVKLYINEDVEQSGISVTSIKMTILKDGTLETVEIVDPSGHEILDNAALQSVRDASPFPPIPAEAGRDKIGVRIYLVFKIT